MKMIDVLNMMSKNEIKEGTKLKYGYKIYNYTKAYTESENCSFVNQEDDRDELLEDNELITTDFLNKEVELIVPEKRKYYLKLYINDDESYVCLSENGFRECYSLWTKDESNMFTTRFTQDEIDNDKLLKFVEMHGIKEDAEE